MKEGLIYVWKIKGLRMLILGASALNFFANMGIMLVLPLFEQYKQLGPGLYGLVMAFFTGGLFTGFLFASVVTVKPEKRFDFVAACSILTSISLIIFPIFINFPLMAACAFIGGFVNAVLNAFILAVFQMTTPRNKRGKVFGLVTSVAGALTPLAYAVGGILAEFIPIRTLISSSFAVNILIFIPILRSRGFKKFINFDPDHNKIEEMH
jgi:MFS family permease